MTFMELSNAMRGMILLWTTFVLIIYIYNLARRLQQGRKGAKIAMTVLLLLLTFVLQQRLSALHARDGLFSDSLSVLFIMTGLIILTGLAMVQHINLLIWQRHHISAMSIKESLDQMPTGICFYHPSGLTKLVNDEMTGICHALTGSMLLDAKAYWESLKEGNLQGCILKGETPIYFLPNGRVYAFEVQEMKMENKPIYEMIAADVTEEYKLTRELEEKQKQVSYINKRLKTLTDTMEYMIMSRELLDLKVSLHDRIGQSLLMTKRYLSDSQAVDSKEWMNMWQLNLRQLKNENPEEWQTPYYVAMRHTEGLGVDLEIKGELPTEEHLLSVVETALVVHVTNVIRHAGGSKAVISVGETEDKKSYELRFTNDGKVPGHKVKEKGGLANLRRKVEEIGGVMRIDTTSRYELILLLPKEEKKNVI